MGIFLCRSGTYEIQPAEGVGFGTKIVIQLKPDCREFSDDENVCQIIGKYSNFVNNPIFVNGKKVNTLRPLWLTDPKSITPQQHQEFYKFISGSYGSPRFTLQYNADVPLSIHALLYFPEEKPGKYRNTLK